MNYYEELWIEVNELYEKGEYSEVITKLEAELKMPYVPSAFEEKYRSLLKETKNNMKQTEKTSQVISDVEELERLLFSTTLEDELCAVNSLKELRIDKYYDLFKSYFKHPIYDEVQSMLIYLLIEQGNKEEWTITKDGCEINFIPMYCELPQESDGYQEAIDFLQEHLAKEPSLLQLCYEILSVHLLAQLPYSYEEGEGEILALSVIKEVFVASDMEPKWEEMCINNGWDSKKVVFF
ncbi:MAG: hypothetical protein IJP28_00870 [Erysipelotrichales bacterium]|nr:hypothetical protein [Erysipelotrichales bacterium]